MAAAKDHKTFPLFGPWDLFRLKKNRQPKQMRHIFTALHLAADENISWAARMPGHASARITCAGTDNLPPSLIRLDGSAFEIILVENAENGSNPAASGFK